MLCLMRKISNVYLIKTAEIGSFFDNFIFQILAEGIDKRIALCFSELVLFCNSTKESVMPSQRIEIKGDPISMDILWQAFTLEDIVVFTILSEGEVKKAKIKMSFHFQDRGQDEQKGDMVGFAGVFVDKKNMVTVDYNCRTGLGWINIS